MRETELRKHRCCFTGHRPEKLTIPENRLTGLLAAEIKRAIDSGHTTFITGMAKGVDIVAAEIVLRLRERDPRLKLICALPYPGFGQHWGGGWTERFRQVLAGADLEQTICPSFSYGAYQARNEWTAIEAIDAIDAIDVEAVMQARAEEIASQITVVDEAGNPICTPD